MREASILDKSLSQLSNAENGRNSIPQGRIHQIISRFFFFLEISTLISILVSLVCTPNKNKYSPFLKSTLAFVLLILTILMRII